MIHPWQSTLEFYGTELKRIYVWWPVVLTKTKKRVWCTRVYRRHMTFDPIRALEIVKWDEYYTEGEAMVLRLRGD